MSRMIDAERYEALLIAFREKAGNISYAALSAGVARDTARRAWHRGWEERGLRPICDVIQAEQSAARARRAEQRCELSTEILDLERARQRVAAKEELARITAKEDAIDNRAEEGVLVQRSRANVLELMVAASHLIEAGSAVAQELQSNLDQEIADLTPSQTIKFIAGTAVLVKTSSQAALLTMQLERLLMGEATEIVAVQEANTMSVDEAARKIAVAQRALRTTSCLTLSARSRLAVRSNTRFSPVPNSPRS